MKRYLVILLLSAACFGQVSSGTARRIVGGTKPATCSAGPPADVWVDTVASPHALNLCTATNTWTAVGGGGGGAVTSVFTRTGAVTAQSADYGLGLIGNPAAGTTFSYATNQNSDWVFQGTGSFNVTGVSTVTGVANNTSLFTLKRFTDTSPTGKMLDFQNAIGGSVASIGIDGTPTFPAFSLANGTTATTQTAGDNSTKVATTAFVGTAVAAAVGTTWVTALPSSGIEGQRVILNNTTGADDLQYNGEFLWHTDAWVWLDAMNSGASLLVSGTIHSPVWLAYLSSTQNVSGTNVFPELHMLHLPKSTVLDFRSTTVAGLLDMEDVITSNSLHAFDFTTGTFNGDVALKNLSGTATTFRANNPIGGRLTLDNDASLTDVTATAPQFSITNVNNAGGPCFSLSFSGGDGDLVLNGPFSNWTCLSVDGTSSTATSANWSAINPDVAQSFQPTFTDAVGLTTIMLPTIPTWESVTFTGDALSQSSVDDIICKMSLSTYPFPAAIYVDTSGGTSAAPSATGLVCLNTIVVTNSGSATWNHTADLAITAVDQGTKTFTVAGDHTAQFAAGGIAVVAGSTGNNANYTVVSATLNTGNTDIVVSQAIPNATADGTIGN